MAPVPIIPTRNLVVLLCGDRTRFGPPARNQSTIINKLRSIAIRRGRSSYAEEDARGGNHERDVGGRHRRGDCRNQRKRPADAAESGCRRGYPFPRKVRRAILAVSNRRAHVATISRLNFLLPELYAEALERLCRQSEVPRKSIELIGCHGQTIYHEGSSLNHSWADNHQYPANR